MMIMTNGVKKHVRKIRSSISFPQKIYTYLEEIAYEKRISLAWVVRDAVEFYLKRQKEGKNAKNA
jgi:metal-responsive CopG/Arc/MetJ family transcriptional regulator